MWFLVMRLPFWCKLTLVFWLASRMVLLLKTRCPLLPARLRRNRCYPANNSGIKTQQYFGALRHGVKLVIIWSRVGALAPVGNWAGDRSKVGVWKRSHDDAFGWGRDSFGASQIVLPSSNTTLTSVASSS